MISHPMFAALPASVRERLTEWTKSLEAALGDNLVSILLTGGVARGDYRPGESDVNAVVVLRDASFAHLDAISSAMQAARYGARLDATIMREDELLGACDAFPLLYDEVKRYHIVLVGSDPLAPITVRNTYRRFRIEQELRQARIGLRHAVTDALGAPEAIGGAVHRKARQVRRPLRALFALRGIDCKEDLDSVLAAAQTTYGIPSEALAKPRETPEAAYNALSKILGAAIDDVASLEPGPTSQPGF